jgi:hypothetical protein
MYTVLILLYMYHVQIAWDHENYAISSTDAQSYYGDSSKHRQSRGAHGDDAFNSVLAAYVTDEQASHSLSVIIFKY